MKKIKKVLKLFVFLLTISLISFAFFGEDALFLLKAISLSIAIPIIYLLYLSKSSESVNKGDEIIAIGANYLIGKKGIALTKASKNERIKIKFYDGKEAEGVVEKTEGLFSPAIVRVFYEEEVLEK